MLSISRILALLAGAFISAVLLRKKENSSADAASWRPDLEALQKKFAEHLSAHESDGPRVDLTARLAELQPKIEAMAAQLAPKPDARIDALTAHLTELQPKIEAIAAELAAKPDARIDDLAARLAAVESKADSTQEKVADLQQKVSAHDLKLEATNHVVVAIEQVLNAKVAEFDQSIEAQGRSLQAMNTSIAQSDELLERILDLVQNLPPSTAEPRKPVTIA